MTTDDVFGSESEPENTPPENTPPKRAPKPKPARVRQHNPDDYTGTNSRTVASFTHPDPEVAEYQARQYIKTHHPRGREVYLHLPDGTMEHYSADLEAQDGPGKGWIEYSEDEDS